MHLKHSTWPAIEAYLKRSTLIIIPVGSIEQHGPTGLLGTDAICPEQIAAHAASDDILVAPTFSVGIAEHHMAFPGTITLRASTMRAAMADWMGSLYRHGFRHFIWFNGHGGNIDTLHAGASDFTQSIECDPKKDDQAVCLIRNWWDYRSVKQFCSQAYPVGDGMHATASEISVTRAAYPHLSTDQNLEPKIAPPFEPFRDAKDYRRKFPDGRVGSDPSLSNSADGAEIIRLSSAALSEEAASLLA
ncbi:MAG: creatininase family protein [Pseudomonadota bacterium]